MSDDEAPSEERDPTEGAADAPIDEAGLEALLDYLHRARGFDFTGYKTSSLSRRIGRRMQLVGQKTFGEYLDYLEVHPDEFPQLFNTVLTRWKISGVFERTKWRGSTS